MLKFLKDHWFFSGMALAVIMAFAAPELGEQIREWHVLRGAIFAAFLIVGLTLDTSHLFAQAKDIKPLATAAVSSLLLMPLISLLLVRLTYGGDSDFGVGTFIISVAPVTVASGTVMTAIALGNVALSLLICVVCNALALLTIPFLLPWMLQFGEALELPVWKMFLNLLLIVFVPTLIGQLLRTVLANRIEPYKKAMSIFSQCVVLLIIFNALSSSSEQISSAGSELAGLCVFIISLRFIFMGISYLLAKAIGLDRPSISAFTIHTSQKTLTVSYVIWAGYFAETYPLAMMPGIIYHLTQMITDTFVARGFRRKTEQSVENL